MRPIRHTRSLLLALAIAVILAACGSGAGDTTTTGAPATTTQPESTTISEGGAEASISISDFLFSAPASIAVGTTVTVVNNDDISHTWTSEDDVFDSGSLGQGDTFEFTFEEPGDYAFFCKFHQSQMTGSIAVEG
jgi:plastocyanin